MNIINSNRLLSKFSQNREAELLRDAQNQPQQLSGVYDLDGRPEDVFALIADQSELPRWLSFYNQMLLGHKTAKASELADGSLSYSYSTNSVLIPSRNHRVSIVAEANGRGGTLLTWNLYFTAQKTIKSRFLISLISAILLRSMENLQIRFGGPGGGFERHPMDYAVSRIDLTSAGISNML